MKIKSFSVSNFRSITSAHKIDMANDLTILIGKNNEGKSNLLRALQVAMDALQRSSERRLRNYIIDRLGIYNWERDFPIQLQGKRRSAQTIFKIDFLLDNSEITEFKELTGANLNGILPIEIKIGKDDIPIINIKKSGKNASQLTSKVQKISSFIGSRVSFNYIPAIRTDKEALDVVQRMLSHELRLLENNDRYIQALKAIENLQQPVLAKLAEQIQKPLSEFLPSIKKVSIEISEVNRKIALRRDIDIIIDDGIETSLEYKGDGVKSLAALGLLKNKTETAGASIIAIEEPESHLHPGAIHQINEIINSLSKMNQVILTTHNPLFVNRENLKSNIIIDKGKANPAKNIDMIRDVLGIRASDNLIHANYALLVEGNGDVKIFKAILPVLSNNLAKALKNNLLIIKSMGGSGNLLYELSLLRTCLCLTHTYLDHDEAGRNALEKARREGLIDNSSYTMSICAGMKDSEIEDCLDINCYKDAISREFGIDITSSKFSPKFKNSRKWSDRMKDCFILSGRLGDDHELSKAKAIVAEEVSKNPHCLNQHKCDSIKALVDSLERMLANI